MLIIYRTNNSIEADAICSNLSEHGIACDCSRNDSFHAVSGVNHVMFEISVSEDMEQQAWDVIREQSGEYKSTKAGSRRHSMARIVAIISLVVIVLGLAASIISAVM